jgi:hypothetical protein
MCQAVSCPIYNMDGYHRYVDNYLLRLLNAETAQMWRSQAGVLGYLTALHRPSSLECLAGL